MIALVDYGAGNLASVRKGLAAAGAESVTVSHPIEIGDPEGIVIPGVGHFGATRALDGAWRSAIAHAVDRGTALLGICLGMQWLFEGSEEAPDVPGLGVIPGTCRHLPVRPQGDTAGQVKVPHVGWNRIHLTRASRLFDGVDDGAFVYFTHAYAAPVSEASVAVTTHGVEFAAAVEARGVFGVQFHPEKSGGAGLAVLRNFVAHAHAG